MRTKRNTALVAIIALMGVLLITEIVWAKATKTCVTGITLVTPSEEEPEREWVDDEGIWHVRGEVAYYEHVGDLEGTRVGVVNLNLDFSTKNGDESGYSTSQLTWGELSGTFEGHFSVTYTGWVVD